MSLLIQRGQPIIARGNSAYGKQLLVRSSLHQQAAKRTRNSSVPTDVILAISYDVAPLEIGEDQCLAGDATDEPIERTDPRRADAQDRASRTDRQD